MGDVLSWVLPIVGGVSLVVAFVFVVKAIVGRGRIRQEAYGFGRQEVRQTIQRDFVYGFLFLVLGLILMGAFSLNVGGGESTVLRVTATPTATRPATATSQVTATEQATARPSATRMTITEPATPTAVVTEGSVTATATATVTPTATLTGTLVPTATVNSEVGLYLREGPGGTQEVELLAHEAVLFLLPGRELAADGTEWQQVRTAVGNEGWVAVAFIIYGPEVP